MPILATVNEKNERLTDQNKKHPTIFSIKGIFQETRQVFQATGHSRKRKYIGTV